MKSLRLVLVLLLATVPLSSCASGSDSGGDGLGDLGGRTFVSTQVTEGGADRTLVAGTEVRLDFENGSLGASAGCNSMGGAYRVDGDALLLPEGLATTEIACEPALMDQDAWLAELLTSEPVLELVGDALTVTSGPTVIELADREAVIPE